MKMVGICGGSCSGKSTLAGELNKQLEGSEIIHLDDFFVGKETLKGQTVSSWEEPSLYRLDEFIEVIKTLKLGREVTFKANSRESRKEGLEYRTVRPRKYILVEGFLIYLREEFTKYFDKKIYLDISTEEIIKRRMGRMAQGGGQYPKNYLTEILIPAHQKFVLPQRQLAELIIDATKPINDLVKLSLSYIHQ
jgi:uridine kinase